MPRDLSKTYGHSVVISLYLRKLLGRELVYSHIIYIVFLSYIGMQNYKFYIGLIIAVGST